MPFPFSSLVIDCNSERCYQGFRCFRQRSSDLVTFHFALHARSFDTYKTMPCDNNYAFGYTSVLVLQGCAHIFYIFIFTALLQNTQDKLLFLRRQTHFVSEIALQKK